MLLLRRSWSGVLVLAHVCAGVGACRPTRSPVRAAAPVDASAALAEPTAPTDLVASLRVAHPRASLDRVARGAGGPLLFDPLFLLGMASGIDSLVLTAVDLLRPLDVVVVGSSLRLEPVYVFAPTDAASVRDTFATLYRFVLVAGFGERLESRTPRTVTHSVCALVGVAATPPVRIVCSERWETLERVGRWAARRGSVGGAGGEDLTFHADGAGLHQAVIPALRSWILPASATVGPDAGAATGRSPTEGLLVAQLAQTLSDASTIDLRVRVGTDEVSVVAEIDLNPSGTSGLARYATVHAATRVEHSAALVLDPDPLFAIAAALASPSDAGAGFDGEALAATAAVIARDAADGAAMRRDASMIFGSSDDFAASMGRDERIVAVLHQRGGHAGAMAALGILSRAAWLPRIRWSGDPVTVSRDNGSIAIRTNPPSGAHALVLHDVELVPMPVLPSSTAVISVQGDSLVLRVGRSPSTAASPSAPSDAGVAPSPWRPSSSEAIAGLVAPAQRRGDNPVRFGGQFEPTTTGLRARFTLGVPLAYIGRALHAPAP